jgi:hypothetical protein
VNGLVFLVHIAGWQERGSGNARTNLKQLQAVAKCLSPDTNHAFPATAKLWDALGRCLAEAAESLFSPIGCDWLLVESPRVFSSPSEILCINNIGRGIVLGVSWVATAAYVPRPYLGGSAQMRVVQVEV